MLSKDPRPWFHVAVCTGCGSRFAYPDGAGHDLTMVTQAPESAEEAQVMERFLEQVLASPPKRPPLAAGIVCW